MKIKELWGEILGEPSNLIFYILISAVFIYGIILRLKIPSIPFTGPDSIGYLGVAFNYLDKDTFNQIAERNFPYPAMITFLIAISKDISVVPIAQHILGIIGGLLYLRIMNILKVTFLNLNNTELYIYKLITVLGLFLLLISPWQITIEHYTHPESVTMPIIMFYIYAGLKLYSQRKISIKSGKIDVQDLLWSTIFLLTNYLIYVFQPRFTIAALLGGLVFYYFQSRAALPKKISLIIIPTLFVIAFINIPIVKNFTYKEAIDCNRSGSLFFYNLNTIIPIIKKDINDSGFQKFDKKILNQIVTDFNEAKSSENRNFSSGFIKTIGYNGDYLMRSYNFILNSLTFREASGFYSYYIYKAFLINPMGLIKKISLEMIYFYDESNVFSEQGSKLKTWKNSLDVVQSWKPIFLKNHKVYDSYVERLNIVKDYAYDYNVPTNNFLKKISVALNNIYIFICILFLFSLFICCKTYKSILPFGIFTLFIFLIINSIILNISVGATTVIGRYIYDIYSLNLLFILSSVFFIILTLKNIITHLIQKNEGQINEITFTD
jgi:hypothetical protein